MDDTSSFGTRVGGYVGNVRVPARKCKPMALLLVQSAPADRTPEEATRLGTVVQRGDEVDDSITVRERSSGAALRGPRNELTSAASAVHGRLVSATALPEAFGTPGVDARALLDTLFPEGILFTQRETVEVWQHSNRLRERILEEGHRPKLVEVVGEPFVRWLEHGIDQLGHAIGVAGDAVPDASPRIVAESVARFGAAVGAYCRVLAASVDPSDPASVARFDRAVAPIDELRTKRSEGEGDGDEDEVVTDSPVRPGMPGADPFTPSP